MMEINSYHSRCCRAGGRCDRLYFCQPVNVCALLTGGTKTFIVPHLAAGHQAIKAEPQDKTNKGGGDKSDAQNTAE